ncbi:hypothetical protein [Conexibacter arvalis]|uniref:DUF2283 domain-containing protein n=1 Tax=Conexibacter arvalis TaxID=912552 RepID=A0A840ID33_9ACTN|nr:hypothetical protein [Conexibacter arvalis]MBB4662255.1 hypothetical protein [Conexibacter arvalis]
MKAVYDSEANAIEITLADVRRVDRDVPAHPCGTVALADGRPVSVELLNVRAGVDDAVDAIVTRFAELDGGALRAAADAALAVPGRQVEITVTSRAA